MASPPIDPALLQQLLGALGNGGGLPQQQPQVPVQQPQSAGGLDLSQLSIANPQKDDANSLQLLQFLLDRQKQNTMTPPSPQLSPEAGFAAQMTAPTQISGGNSFFGAMANILAGQVQDQMNRNMIRDTLNQKFGNLTQTPAMPQMPPEDPRVTALIDSLVGKYAPAPNPGPKINAAGGVANPGDYGPPSSAANPAAVAGATANMQAPSQSGLSGNSPSGMDKSYGSGGGPSSKARPQMTEPGKQPLKNPGEFATASGKDKSKVPGRKKIGGIF